MSEGAKVSEVFIRHLSVYIGQRTAPMAMKTFSKQAFAMAPEELQLAHVPKLLDAMRPMLNTLLGKEKAEEVVKLIRTELKI